MQSMDGSLEVLSAAPGTVFRAELPMREPL